jgi:hypothetical protein
MINLCKIKINELQSVINIQAQIMIYTDMKYSLCRTNFSQISLLHLNLPTLTFQHQQETTKMNCLSAEAVQHQMLIVHTTDKLKHVQSNGTVDKFIFNLQVLNNSNHLNCVQLQIP